MVLLCSVTVYGFSVTGLSEMNKVIQVLVDVFSHAVLIIQPIANVLTIFAVVSCLVLNTFARMCEAIMGGLDVRR